MKILVYTLSDQPSGIGKPAIDRHLRIMESLKKYQPNDHRVFEKKNQVEKDQLVDEWDKPENIIIAHLTDIHPNQHNHLPKLLNVKKATCVFHCYHYPINNDEIVERVKKNPNVIFANSDKVIKNIKLFVEELIRTGSISIAYLSLIEQDEMLESLLKPFEVVSPIEDSKWRLELSQAKNKLNDYLKKANPNKL